MNSKSLCRAGVIAGLYCVLTVIVAPLSYGQVQFRFAEALTVLPLFFPEAVLGLTTGCFIANILGNGTLDLILGTLATLISSLLTSLAGRKIKKFAVKLIVGEIFPVVINALLVPFTFLAFSKLKSGYFIGVLTVGGGQLAVIATLGTFLAVALRKIEIKKTTL